MLAPSSTIGEPPLSISKGWHRVIGRPMILDSWSSISYPHLSYLHLSMHDPSRSRYQELTTASTILRQVFMAFSSTLLYISFNHVSITRLSAFTQHFSILICAALPELFFTRSCLCALVHLLLFDCSSFLLHARLPSRLLATHPSSPPLKGRAD